MVKSCAIENKILDLKCHSFLNIYIPSTTFGRSYNESSSVGKLLWTLRAKVEFLPDMRSHVDIQLRFLRKLFVTISTRVRFHTGVGSHVQI